MDGGQAQAAAVPGGLRPRRRGARMGVIERYRDRLPVGPATPALTLGEGRDAADPGPPRLGERLGVELYFKFEGMNPTGSFKDRGMAVAVAKAVENGRDRDHLRLDRQHRRVGRRLRRARRAASPSSSARPARSPPRSSPSRAPSVRRCSRCAAASTRRCAAASRWSRTGSFALVNSLNPHRIEGQKTAAFEIDEELGRAPDVLALPYGGGGNTSRTPRASPRTGSRPGSSPPRRSSAP